MNKQEIIELFEEITEQLARATRQLEDEDIDDIDSAIHLIDSVACKLEGDE
ncbi:hypothetical protein K2V56_10460 [Staphylococcus chromogenes]|uniref:hypothetical protein n=1 Tax=Staphylococcus chromogenes TaxID=46126 RepID=UPI001E2C80B2|nr:hypothetical protein [Staphylococcus chromogenes]MCD8905905.1 hypothetical protein [Staphylococcus chromogenes]